MPDHNDNHEVRGNLRSARELKYKKTVGRLRDRLERKDSELADLNTKLEEKEEVITQLEDYVVVLEDAKDEEGVVIANLKEKNRDKSIVIAKLKESVRDQGTAIANLKNDNRDKETAIADLKTSIRSKECDIMSLDANRAAVTQLFERFGRETAGLSEDDKLHAAVSRMDRAEVNNNVNKGYIKSLEDKLDAAEKHIKTLKRQA
ncbi:hypothetical protein HBH53_210390 [Parastagonospora nodorum]|nr:hypothetical protein HBH53_210390 [Parastagonospora nodorum]KAH3958455.1 hypothetical protein HBH51_208920 [Parastagonospora nodorum]KAH4001559.1 hypothetical protein HBI10_090870 [Parastagonospora nodorum]KAH4027493.1 hypothetical protein HBI13_059890 [Parastagonospora nodorum]KAH4930244.1 hypothetical protein HBH74_100750 [Parastagonospora nodorum]